MTPHLGAITLPYLRILMKHLNNNNFKAKAHLLQALGTPHCPPHTSEQYPLDSIGSYGILQNSGRMIEGHLELVLGSLESNNQHGVLGACLSNDW